jgi:predicted dehydrogenase
MRLGLIGAGSRGQELVRNFLRVPGVRITAAADVYPLRFEQLNKVCGYSVARHDDYRALLDRKDLDAIVIATPLGLHTEHVLPALKSGRPVYGEKTMAYTVEQAREIVAEVASSKRVFQVGHQYRYSAWIRAAVARVQAGEIGNVTHVLAYWNRNNSWRRPVPDPSLERLINWRLYNEWSLGLIAELGSHHMDIANWIMGSPPISAQASGSICCYHDGRETDDNVQVVLSYPNGRRMIFSSMTNNAMMGDQLWLYGTKGSLNLTLQDATFYFEPRRVEAVKVGKEYEPVVTGASYNPANEMPYRGPGKPVQVKDAEDPTMASVRAFVYCVRNGERPIADEHVGLGAALAVVSAHQARMAKREVEIAGA